MSIDTSNYDVVIGLEVHIQLNTKSKAFAYDVNQFTSAPNQHISPITAALPGVLPLPNQLHLYKAIKLACALGCEINNMCYFDRKQYNYPDLPKGYQITQDGSPIAIGGSVTFPTEGSFKTIKLHHFHMEEDAGKSIHDLDDALSYVDLNRAGTPLLEVVTEPDLKSGQEVHDFLAYMQLLVQYLDISDGNMEEGSIRCDCNVSIRPSSTAPFGERCEVKNVNSKRYARQAISFEIDRQKSIVANGGTITRNTMLFDPISGITRPIRSKESANDYRYFPDPDLPLITIDENVIDHIATTIDYTPHSMRLALSDIPELAEEHIDLVLEDKSYGIYLLEQLNKPLASVKEFIDLLVLKIIPSSKELLLPVNQALSDIQVSEVLQLLASGQVSKSALYQSCLPQCIYNTDQSPLKLAQAQQLLQAEDQSFVDPIIDQVLANFPDKVKEYQQGKKGLIGFFMGQVKREVGNKAEPKTLQDKLSQRLDL